MSGDNSDNFGYAFLPQTHGFRPGRNPHDALRALRGIIVTKKVGHLFEADIRGYFNHIQHEMLQKMVAHRIADPLILRLIGKWLNAGYMLEGVVVRTEEGSPQGGPISPILANIYLHYTLDLWFEKKIKPTCQGEAYLTRFADPSPNCCNAMKTREAIVLPNPLGFTTNRRIHSAPHHRY